MMHGPECGHPFCSSHLPWSLQKLRGALKDKGLTTRGKQHQLVQRLHDAALAEQARAFLSPGNLPAPQHRKCQPEPRDAARAARCRARLCLYEPAAVGEACSAYLALASRTWHARRLSIGQRSGTCLLPQEAVEHIIAFLLRARRDAVTLALRETPHGAAWELQPEALPGLVRGLLRAGAHPDHRPRSYNGTLVGRPPQIAILLEDCLFPGRATSSARFYRCLPESVLRDVVQALVDAGARASLKVEWCPGSSPELDTDLLGLLCAFGRYLGARTFEALFDALLGAKGDLNASVRVFLRYYSHEDIAHTKLRAIFARVLEHVRRGTLTASSRPPRLLSDHGGGADGSGSGSGSERVTAATVCPEVVAEVEELIRTKRARIGL
mmetsp:Transcript_98063/g.281779  ORF Transcript_98063/g.281779 Transcript_98063/m.281779 type:complete len:382 (-) Transcript_98063:9-1154(-)